VLLLLAAATALGGAVVLAHAGHRGGQRERGHYVCPMHVEVVSGAPGDCPICGMALEQVKEWTPPAAAGDVRVDTAKPLVLATQVRAPARLSADGVVTAVLYKDDFIGMAPGERALFFGASAPAVGIEVRRSAEEPARVDNSTSKVRFRIDRDPRTRVAASSHLDVGLLQIAARPRAVLVVPASAVLFSADGPYALAASRDGDPFAKRPVEIGRILDSSYAAGVSGDSIGAIVVLSGLRAGERVVAGDTFFVDAERRLRLGRGQSQVAP
jgi:multidrug efflux pump subunit AcrA (membrane-fusion protein)